MEILQPSPSPFPLQQFCSGTPRSRRRKMKWELQKQPPQLRRRHRHPNPSQFYPHSSPTPLLPTKTPPPSSKEAHLDQILSDIEQAASQGVKIEPSMFASLLETCSKLGAFNQGARLRRLIPPSLLKSHLSLSSKLIKLYASCGFPEEAHHLFDAMPQKHRTKSAFPWNSLIAGYAERGFYHDAMAIYLQMEEEGVTLDRFTFPRAIKACAGLKSLSHGVHVHRHAIRCGFGSDPFVLNALVDMYAKCGDIAKASAVFSKISEPDNVAMNAMLLGFLRHGMVVEALELFRKMEDPDSVAVSGLLSATAGLGLGEEIHGWALRRGLTREVSVGNALVYMYGEREMVTAARAVFYSMEERDIVSWNSMIRAHKNDERVVSIFREMVESGVEPDIVTFVSLLDALASLGLVEEGEEVFATMEGKYGVGPTGEHVACMVNLLGKAGYVERALEMAEAAGESTAAWGALLDACCRHGDVRVAEVAAGKLFELELDNEKNYEIMAKIYGEVGRLEDEERMMRMMAERGLDC